MYFVIFQGEAGVGSKVEGNRIIDKTVLQKGRGERRNAAVYNTRNGKTKTYGRFMW